jgi:hypothetical protein
MRPRTGADGANAQEDKFCKTNSPKPRGICQLRFSRPAQKARLRCYLAQNTGRKLTRTRTAQHRNLVHRKESCSGPTRPTWNKHVGGHARGKRRPSWTSRFPDPEGREAATPFPCWPCIHLSLRQWVPPSEGDGTAGRNKKNKKKRKCTSAEPVRP